MHIHIYIYTYSRIYLHTYICYCLHLKQGKGILWHADGSTYEGDFIQGRAHGDGKFLHAPDTNDIA